MFSRKNSQLIKILVLFLYTFISVSNFAQTHKQTPQTFQSLDVKLNIISGQVKLTRVGSTFTDVISSSTELYSGDLIETMQESKAELVYNDGAIMRLKPRTLVEVQANTIKVFKGKVWHKFTKKGTEFVIDTPSLIAGIRGTIFDTSVSTKGKTMFSVLEGVISVKSKKDSNKTILVKQGYATHADVGEDPVTPYKFNLSSKQKEWDESEWLCGEKSVEQLFINYITLKNEYGENDPRVIKARIEFEEAKKAKLQKTKFQIKNKK